MLRSLIDFGALGIIIQINSVKILVARAGANSIRLILLRFLISSMASVAKKGKRFCCQKQNFCPLTFPH